MRSSKVISDRPPAGKDLQLEQTAKEAVDSQSLKPIEQLRPSIIRRWRFLVPLIDFHPVRRNSDPYAEQMLERHRFKMPTHLPTRFVVYFEAALSFEHTCPRDMKALHRPNESLHRDFGGLAQTALDEVDGLPGQSARRRQLRLADP